MRDEIALICLGEGAEPGDDGEGDIVAEEGEVDVEVVEGGEEVGGVQARGDGVLEVVVLAGVGVGERADVADEGAFLEDGFKAVALGGVVVGGGGHDGWVMGLDGGVDAAGFGVGGEDGVDEGVELGVCLDVRGDEEFGFVADVGEDEGGGDLGVMSFKGMVSGCFAGHGRIRGSHQMRIPT